MEALRKAFFLEVSPGPDNYRRTMSLYHELIIQFGPNFDLSRDPGTEFIFVETERAKRGQCHIWQNVDGKNKNFYYQGSRTYICEFGISVVNEDEETENDVGDENFDFTDDELKTIINNTLGNVLGFDADDCDRVPFPPSLRNPTTTGSNCVFQMFDGYEPPDGLWEGSWSTFMAADWTVDDDYDKIKAPLENGDGDPVVFFGGEHMCLRYNGYVNGAYYSGLEEANNVLKALLPESEYNDWSPNALYNANCDV